MWEAIGNFFTAVPWWELLLILACKSVEVTLSTLRVILIAKGYRKYGTMLAFAEILLWVFVASTVINGMAEAPIKGLMYAIGFTIGVYLGSRVESWLAFGKIFVQVIINKEEEDIFVPALREMGFAATTVEAHGRDQDKTLVMIIAHRRGKESLFSLISDLSPKAVIVSNDVSTLKGGYVKSWKRIIK